MTKTKCGSIILAAGLLAGCTPPAARRVSTLEVIKERGKIIVGVKADSPPFGFRGKDGDLWGFDIDLARKIAERLDVRLVLLPVTSATREKQLLDGLLQHDHLVQGWVAEAETVVSV